MINLILIFLILVEFLMGLFTFLFLDPENGILLFPGGSIGSTMRIFAPNFWIVFSLFLLTILSTILFIKRMNLLFLTFSILFSTWFFSGRTIGVSWTGELITGWFYFETNRIILCKGENCMDNIKVTNLNLLQIRVVNGSFNQSIFVGPIINQEIENYFRLVNQNL